MRKIDVLVIVALLLSISNTVVAIYTYDNFTRLNNNLNSFASVMDDLRKDLSSIEGELTSLKESYYPLLIKDSLGRVVTIKSEPMRIVSGSPSITEILFALGASGKIVGVDEYSNYPKELLELKKSGAISTVGGVTTLSPEKVAALNPDLVIIDASLQSKFLQTLEGMGLTVVAIDGKSVSGVKNNIMLISKIISKTNEGKLLVEHLDNAMREVSTKVSASAPTKIFYLVWPDPMYTTGNNTYLNELITIAGGKNIFANRNGWFSVNPEDVVHANPSVIVMSSMSLNKNYEELIAYFMNLPGFQYIDAIKTNRVYILTGNAANALERSGPRLAEAVFILGYILHPEVFNVTLPNFMNEYTIYVGR